MKLESDDKAEVVKVTPQNTQKDGPIVTTSAVYASHSEEDGYLGDGESRDGDSDDSASNLGERDPADGEEHPAPPKYVSPMGKYENLDLECNKVPQIQEESPKIKKLPASEQYNMLGYLNRQDQTDLYDSGALELLISKQSPPKDLQKLSLSLSPPLTISPPLVPAQHTPPEKPPVRALHGRKHQSSAKKISKKGNSKQRSKKQKKHHQRGSIISCGNSLSKAGSFGFASQSQGQSHTSDSVCIGQITRRKRCFQHQDGSSSSSGGKKSSGDSKSGIDSSSTSSDNHQPKKKKGKKKRHSQDKSSSKFETSEDVSTNAANIKEDSSLAFVSGSDLELSSKPEDKASDRESLSSFTSPKAKLKSIKKCESGGSNSLSITESAKHSLPPTSIGDHQPADINELSPAAIGDLPLAATTDYQPAGIGGLPLAGISNLPPTGIGDHHPGCLPPTGIGDHQPSDLPPFWIPFRSLAEEKPQPLICPSTLVGCKLSIPYNLLTLSSS